jgi:hypothetical protein
MEAQRIVSRVRAALVLASCALASPGCLSASYRVASEELSRLARTTPEQRWQSVRVSQRVLESDHPPGDVVPVQVDAPVVLLPTVFWYHGRSWGVPGHWRGNPGAWRAAAPAGGAGPGVVHTGGGRSGGGGHSGGGRSGGGPDAAVVAVAVLAAAGIVFVLAGTEGARYDGWVGVPPDETVFLDHPDGSVSAVPLAALTPELADSASGATIYEGYEGRFLRLGRAPLDRVGFTLQSGLVTALVPHTGVGASGSGFGIGARAFFGGYPLAQLGLGASADVVAGEAGSVLALVGPEVQVMPLLWGGVYLGAGWSSLTSDDHSVRTGGWYVRGGAMFELPVTTRFAASLRAGLARLDYGSDAGLLLMPELSLGLSLY